MSTEQATLEGETPEKDPWKNRDRLKNLYFSGLNQAEIAERLGTTAATISYWMRKFNLSTSQSDKNRDFHNEDVNCQRCGAPTPGNNLQCAECLDEVRAKDREDDLNYDTKTIDRAG